MNNSLKALVYSNFEGVLFSGLNSFIPLPTPFINSGIFFPPNSSKTISTMMMISGPKNKKRSIQGFLFKKFIQTRVSLTLIMMLIYIRA